MVKETGESGRLRNSLVVGRLNPLRFTLFSLPQDDLVRGSQDVSLVFKKCNLSDSRVEGGDCARERTRSEKRR